jgi:predicted site-specific integrase-resolvase
MAEELLTPKILAARLGISPQKVRRRLRKQHPRPAELRRKRWAIPADWAKEIEEQVRKKQLKIIAKVVSQKGTCAAEHKVGDEFTIDDKTPAGLCS